MKKFDKKQMDAIIDLSRQYWGSSKRNGGEPDTTLLVAKFAIAEKIERECGVSWSAVINFVDGVVSTRGIANDATNDEIYCALRCLGWEAANEIETSESV